MNPYPLYDYLMTQINNQPIDLHQVGLTINGIAELEDANDHYQEIQALILHHESVINSNIVFSKIPHEGKVLPGDKGLLYVLAKLPLITKQLIYQYLIYYSQ